MGEKGWGRGGSASEGELSQSRGGQGGGGKRTLNRGESRVGQGVGVVIHGNTSVSEKSSGFWRVSSFAIIIQKLFSQPEVTGACRREKLGVGKIGGLGRGLDQSVEL